MEPNPISFWKLAGEALNLMFGRKRPVAFDSDGSWILATGAPSPDINCAFLSSGDSAEATLFRHLRRFEKLRVPFLVCMTNEAAEAASWKAEKFGLMSVGTLPLMTRSVGASQEPTGISVEVAQTRDQISAYQEFASEQFGLPENVLEQVVPEKSLASGDLSYFLAMIEGEVCGVGATTRQSGKIGIWSMVTAPEKRRQGVATAILHAMSRHHDPADTFYLLSTEEGQALYEKAGFKVVDIGQVYAGRYGLPA